LARAVPSHDAEGFAAFDGETDALQHVKPLETARLEPAEDVLADRTPPLAGDPERLRDSQVERGHLRRTPPLAG
jgi:hypothetical protein